MKSIKALLLLSIFGLSAAACGDDNDDKGGSGGGDMSSYVAECKAFCDAQAAKDCLATDTVEECKTDCDSSAAATGDCAVKTKAYGDCVKKGSDVCTAEESCQSEAMAALAFCLAAQQ